MKLMPHSIVVFPMMFALVIQGSADGQKVYYSKDKTGAPLDMRVTLDNLLIVAPQQPDIDLVQLTSRGVRVDSNTFFSARSYAQGLAGGVEQLVLTARQEEKNGSHDQAMKRVLHLLRLRDKLLVSGGYGNLCLAGSVTSALHAYAWDRIIHGEPIQNELVAHLAVPLQKVVTSIERSAREEGGHPFFGAAPPVKSEDAAGTVRAILGALNPVMRDGRGIENAWQFWGTVEPNDFQGFGFRGEMFESANSANQLVNWLVLIDEQFALKTVSQALRLSADFNDMSMTDAKTLLASQLAEEGKQERLMDLRVWGAKEIYDYYRKFRHGAIDGQSALNARLSRTLAY